MCSSGPISRHTLWRYSSAQASFPLLHLGAEQQSDLLQSRGPTKMKLFGRRPPYVIPLYVHVLMSKGPVPHPQCRCVTSCLLMPQGDHIHPSLWPCYVQNGVMIQIQMNHGHHPYVQSRCPSASYVVCAFPGSLTSRILPSYVGSYCRGLPNHSLLPG